ncbi:uncharacterized protein LOC143561503 [Bidens hawaiensis]|uniref:uncharacterized protein LOC143561503 n=1 Tax=Bidens hawaiensis TaxID=980011 RepID=UPI00404AAE09
MMLEWGSILKKVFTHFGIPKALISERGTQFCNDQMEKVLARYEVHRRLSKPYHPQTSGHVEVTNWGIKRIREKNVSHNRRDWSEKLVDAMWNFCTAFKTPIGTTPFKLVYENSYHLLVKLGHKAYWELKTANLDLQSVGKNIFMQLHELDELRVLAYVNPGI